MAATNKSTGLQIALVFAVMSALVAIVVAFLQYRNWTDAELRLKTASDARAKAESDKQLLTSNLDTLKGFMGYPTVTDIGKPEVEDNSVIGQTKKLMTKVAPGDLAQPTVSATLTRMGQENTNIAAERAALIAERMRLNERVTALSGEYQSLADQHEKARKAAEKDREAAQVSKEQAAAAKDKQIVQQEAKIQELNGLLQTTSAELAKSTEQSKGQIDKLLRVNRGLSREKDELVKESFEVPDGVIEWVDRETKLVWINRGEADGLRRGTSFSVYKQINNGVARGSQGIKAAIEVTRIIGPHQSEARITRSQNNDPIIPGDPIYTPLWHVGRQENFALVGLIDLDGDGVSDRDVLHDVITASNAVIIDEVDDKGVRHPTEGRITVGTKFLVVGNIPDHTQSRSDEKDAHMKIGQLHKKMVEEAQEHGVKIVALNDFLSYIGYEPSRRIYRPGQQGGKWTLRAGSHSTGTKPSSIALPESTGTVSKRYSGNPNLKPPESSGQTSKAYK